MNGTARRPASSIVRRRTAGTLSGEPWWALPGLGEPVRGGLEHQPHRRAHLLQPRELLVGHHPGVEVREQSRLLDHADRDRAHVLERRGVAALVEPGARHGVPVLGPVAEREQRLLAPRPPPRLGDRDDLVGRQVGRVDARGRLRERAVVAAVAAEHRERDEDLARVGDGVAPAEVAQARRRWRMRRVEVVAAGGHQRGGLVEREGLALPRPGPGLGRSRAGSRASRRPWARERTTGPAAACRPRRRPETGGDAGGDVKVAALAGGIGAGKFLRGLARVVPGDELTVVVNVADDVIDPRAARRTRPRLGHLLAGRRVRSRARMGPPRRDVPRDRGAPGLRRRRRLVRRWAISIWRRTCTGPRRLADGATLSAVDGRDRRALRRDGAASCPSPTTRSTTRIDVLDAATGSPLDLHFQEYWVRRRAADAVTGVRYEGAERGAAGAGRARRDRHGRRRRRSARRTRSCRSGRSSRCRAIRAAVAARRRDVVTGVSPIVGGAPVAGMADRLMPAVGHRGVRGWGSPTRYRDLARRLARRRCRRGVDAGGRGARDPLRRRPTRS